MSFLLPPTVLLELHDDGRSPLDQKPPAPRSRTEEILIARGMKQAEIRKRTGWESSNLSRIMSGRGGLSPTSRRVLSQLLECPEPAFIEPIGAPIPPRPGSDIPTGHMTTGHHQTLGDRLRAVAKAVGAPSLEDLLSFIIEGDYSRLPPPVAQRLRSLADND